MTNDRLTTAEKLKQLLIESSSLIEQYTRKVCPDCIDICCKQKHGVYKEKDILYLRALGVEVLLGDEVKQLDGPCQFMGPRGCDTPRWCRPFKCTWYFCEPLLAALNEGPPKKARQLSAVLQAMINLYDML
jgi:hypothetical protein